MTGLGGRITAAFLGFICLGAGAFLLNGGFSHLKRMRAIEQIPPVPVLGVVPGVLSLQGTEEAAESLLTAPRSGETCFYYQ